MTAKSMMMTAPTWITRRLPTRVIYVAHEKQNECS